MNFAVQIDGDFTLIFKKGQGVVLREKTVEGAIAFGRIIDAEKLIAFMKDVFKRVKDVTKQNCVFLIPCSLTALELNEYRKVAYATALGDVEFIPRGVAVAQYWGAEVGMTKSALIVDIYECGTDVCIISGGSITNGGTIDEGSALLKEAIRNYVQYKYHLKIADSQAKLAFEEVGTLFTGMETQVGLAGVNLETARHDEIDFTGLDSYSAISPVFRRISKAIQKVLNSAHIDDVAQIKSGGFYVSGVGSQVTGLHEFFHETLGIKATITETGQNAAILGAGKLIDDSSIVKAIVKNN